MKVRTALDKVYKEIELMQFSSNLLDEKNSRCLRLHDVLIVDGSGKECDDAIGT